MVDSPRSIPPSAVAPPPLLVGRSRELDLLRGHLSAALEGKGRLVLVGGEAGIGKTALIQALGSEAAAQGALVLTGHCYDLTATPPYGPWLDLVEPYRATDGLPPRPTALTDVAGSNEPGGRHAVFAQVRDFFAAVAAVRPLVVVLEDFHWADPASLDLLRFFGHRLALSPILTIVTYRGDEVGRQHPLASLVPALVREARAERVELRRLTTADVRRLVAARHPLPAGDEARLVAYLQSHAEGTPFYIGELLRTLEEEGVLVRDGAAWMLASLSGARVPPLLRQIIEGRLARLGEEAREALAVAAVVGQEVPLAVWSAVGGLSEEALLPVVERAVEARVLDAWDDGAGVRFHHALTREAHYESILPPRRRAWHRRVGEALAAESGPDPDAVAAHFQAAGDPRAVDWLIQAGGRAQRAYAWLTAAERFEAAMALLATEPTRARERAWLRYRVGRLRRFSDPARGVVDLAEAERLAHTVDDSLLAAHALADRGRLRCLVGEMRRGLAEMAAGEEALDALPPMTAMHTQLDPALASWVAESVTDTDRSQTFDSTAGLTPRRGRRVIWLANVGRLVEARTLGERLLVRVAAGPRPRGDELGIVADANHGLALVYASLGQPDAARRANALARAGHQAVGSFVQVAFDALREIVEIMLPYATTLRAERRRLKAEADEAWTRVGGAMETGGPAHLAFFGHGLGLALLEGDWADARELERATRTDSVAGLWQYEAGDLATLARHQGDAELAWALVREVLPEGAATEPGDSLFLASLALQRVAAELALDADDRRLARAWLEAHDRWLVWSGSVPGQAEGQLLWARYHRLAGESGLAQHHAEAALTLAGAPPRPLARLAACRLLGELATDQGRHRDAETNLLAALALADACAAPFERALTQLALTQLYLASGQRDRAIGLLDEARVVCVRLGAAPTIARVDALAAHRATSPAVVYAGGLSGREVEVLRLVAEGLTDQEVADRLSISRRTVGQHLRSVYNKLGVPSRAAATRFAVEHGLL